MRAESDLILPAELCRDIGMAQLLAGRLDVVGAVLSFWFTSLRYRRGMAHRDILLPRTREISKCPERSA
jgi:hypothetical protein